MPLASEQVPPSIQTTVTWTREIRSRWSVVLPPDLCSLHVCSLCITRYTLPPLCGSDFHPNHLCTHLESVLWSHIYWCKGFFVTVAGDALFSSSPKWLRLPPTPRLRRKCFHAAPLSTHSKVQYMYKHKVCITVNRFTAEVHEASCNCKVQGIPQSSAEHRLLHILSLLQWSTFFLHGNSASLKCPREETKLHEWLWLLLKKCKKLAGFFWKMEKSFGVEGAVGFQKVVFAHPEVCSMFCKYLDPCLYECWR